MKRIFWVTLAMLALASTAWAQQPRTYGAWTVAPSERPDMAVAFTMSESGDYLRTACAANGCFWALSVQIACTEDKDQGTLINSANGAWMADMHCIGPSAIGPSYYDVVFKDFNLIDGVVRGGGVIGFAIALRDGRFKVVRFQTTGISDAAREALRLAQQGSIGSKRIPARGPKDEVL